MHTPTYVYQNGFGIYYFRMAIPKHLRPALRKREIRRSLKTTNQSYAVRQARRLAVLTEELFLSGINDKAHFETCFKNGINSFSDNVKRLPGNIGYLEERKIASCTPFATITTEPISTSLTINDLISQCVECQDVENSWQQKTKDENLAIFNTLVEIVGNVQLSDLNHQVADNFRATLKKLPPNMNKSVQWRNLSVEQILKEKPTVTLSDSSVNKYMRRVAAMFNFAVDSEDIAKNYFRKKPIQESKKANQKRDMLTNDDIAALLTLLSIKRMPTNRIGGGHL